MTKCDKCGKEKAQRYVVFQGIRQYRIISEVAYLCRNCYKKWLQGNFFLSVRKECEVKNESFRKSQKCI